MTKAAITPGTGQASTGTPHIAVCVCTYKRPVLLQRLLTELGRQATDGLFTYSVVIVDNDRLRSAEPVVSAFAGSSNVPVMYCVEARQNIALARNKAVECAVGDFVAFIDDDEFPTERWLATLHAACNKYRADGALGPVKPHFDEKPPGWVVKGKFYDRPSYPTGFVIDWKKGRTGNTLLRKSVLSDEQPFRPECLTGEDQDFFARMIDRGHVFVWCDEAVAYETVPPKRWERVFMLRRAMLSGATTLVQPAFGAREIAKTLIAVPAYTIGLPFAFVMGQDKFMTLLVKLFDHIGKLLALVGIQPVKEPYVTE
jgi:succinoglycan biosynthesis protein ExoM